MSSEFLIKGANDNEPPVYLNSRDWHRTLRPVRTPSVPIQGWGDHRIEVEGAEVSFSHEPPGIHVVFETGSLSGERKAQIVQEIAENYVAQTSQQIEIVELD